MLNPAFTKKEKTYTLKLEEFDSAAELSNEDQGLIKTAKEFCGKAYAPYSRFFVGAAVLLENGEVIGGNNQENAAYPSGLCAERVALFAASALHPNSVVKTLAITCSTDRKALTEPVSPCGACRQVIAEYEHRQKKKIRIIMTADNSNVLIADGIETLLPFMFSGDSL